MNVDNINQADILFQEIIAPFAVPTDWQLYPAIMKQLRILVIQ